VYGGTVSLSLPRTPEGRTNKPDVDLARYRTG